MRIAKARLRIEEESKDLGKMAATGDARSRAIRARAKDLAASFLDH